MAFEFEHGRTMGVTPPPACIVLYDFNVGRLPSTVICLHCSSDTTLIFFFWNEAAEVER